MYRSFIPLAPGAGKFMSITQPAHHDRLVLDAMGLLLREVLEANSLGESHGFRVAKCERSFFNEVSRWPEMDEMIQCDAENSLRVMDHELLLNLLLDHLGKSNEP
jgi:hypothetical protein